MFEAFEVAPNVWVWRRPGIHRNMPLARDASHDIRDASHDIAGECDRLIALAEAMPAVSERRRSIVGAWYDQLLELTQAPSLETPDGELAVDALVSQLRRAWMAPRTNMPTPPTVPRRSPISRRCCRRARRSLMRTSAASSRARSTFAFPHTDPCPRAGRRAISCFRAGWRRCRASCSCCRRS
jgi:hypothetical protein